VRIDRDGRSSDHAEGRIEDEDTEDEEEGLIDTKTVEIAGCCYRGEDAGGRKGPVERYCMHAASQARASPRCCGAGRLKAERIPSKPRSFNAFGQ